MLETGAAKDRAGFYARLRWAEEEIRLTKLQLGADEPRG
jgi:hypothetical protein